MKRIFLTGGTGVIGRELVSKLLEKGFSVSLLSRNKEASTNFEEKGVNYIHADILQPKFYQRELQNSDIVIHLAAEVKVGHLGTVEKEKLIHTNIEGTKRIFKLFKESSCDQLIYTSTRQIYGETNGLGNESSPHNGVNQSFYVKTKYFGHKLALHLIRKGFPITILISGTVYSPTSTLNGINKLFALYYNGIKASLFTDSFNTYVDSEDVATGFLYSISCKKAIGEEIIIANGYTTYDTLYAICEEITGAKVRSIKIPLMLARLGATFGSPLIYRFLGRKILLNKENLNNLQNSCKLSNQKSKDLLNMKYKPLLPSIIHAFEKQYESLNKTSISLENFQ